MAEEIRVESSDSELETILVQSDPEIEIVHVPPSPAVRRSVKAANAAAMTTVAAMTTAAAAATALAAAMTDGRLGI